MSRVQVGEAVSAPEPPWRYPLMLDLTDRAVLVVGGGPVAARRALGLVQSGARVHVIAPDVCEDLADLVAEGAVIWWPREVSLGDLSGPAAEHPGDRWWLVHTATGDHLTDSAIALEAERRGIWCVRADRAHASAAHTPAVAHGPDGVQIAVSGGGDPGRARSLRDAISDLLATGTLPLRRTRRSSGRSLQVRGAWGPADLDELPRSPLGLGSIPRNDRAGGGAGRVVLVGGGPGDPGLLTVAGRQWLARADVVVADRLGPVEVLSELDPTVQVIDVGKSAGHHPIPQTEINDLLVEHALAGRLVVRLKGGDPFVLGRGAEEALHCRAHGVPVEVVPGVTSAISVPAAAGIPVTHRGMTTSVVIASAHAGAGPAVDAARHAPADATVVLLMGLGGLAGTAAELVAAGRLADTPVAVISQGWTPGQRTVTGTLGTIARDVAAAELPGPVVIVVGEVVALRAQIGDLARRAGSPDPRAGVTIG